VIEEVSGQTWEQFVQTRLFDPLGMTRSTLTIEDNINGPEPAVPYSERRDSTTLYRQPYYTAEVAIAPAGAINSNVQDLSRWVIALLNGGRVDGKQVIPDAVLRETMAPALPLPNTALRSRGWGEILNVAYGMGRQTASYRGHLISLHGGDLPGFHSQVSIMPNDSIGVIVLVIGDHVAPLYNGLTYHIYERLLGMPLTPWPERLNEIRLKNKAAGTKARAVASAGRIEGTRPSHALDDYLGEYEHPAYGVLAIARGDTGLTFDLHGIKMPLSHFHYDRFDTPDDEEDGKFSVNFRTNPMGEVDGAELSLDESAVTFTRRVPPALLAEATLRPYAGTYRTPSGGKLELEYRPGVGLVLPGGNPTELKPWRPHQFRIKEFPDVVISFDMENGRVLAMRQRDPSGEYVFPRAP
jgi:hypothetical protein